MDLMGRIMSAGLSWERGTDGTHRSIGSGFGAEASPVAAARADAYPGANGTPMATLEDRIMERTIENVSYVECFRYTIAITKIDDIYGAADDYGGDVLGNDPELLLVGAQVARDGLPPPKRISPLSAARVAVRMLMVVLFPAPLGPRMQSTSPGMTSKPIPQSTWFPLKLLVRPRTDSNDSICLVSFVSHGCPLRTVESCRLPLRCLKHLCFAERARIGCNRQLRSYADETRAASTRWLRWVVDFHFISGGEASCPNRTMAGNMADGQIICHPWQGDEAHALNAGSRRAKTAVEKGSPHA